MYLAAEKGFFEHLWDSAHPLLAHFPIALLSFAFIFTLVGYVGKLADKYASNSFVAKWNISRFYRHVWTLQWIGTVFIYPTMLFGSRDYDNLSEFGQDLAESHEEWGGTTTNFYILITIILGLSILHFRYMNKKIGKGTLLSRVMKAKYSLIEKMPMNDKIMRIHEKAFKNDPIKSFLWLIVSAIAFVMLAYTGYLGGELTHEQGIIAGGN